jgi:hypothetical protein
VSFILDLFITIGLVWILVRVVVAARRRGKDPHMWGEFNSSQVAKVLDPKRRRLL